MTPFDTAVTFVLKYEGGLSDDPADPRLSCVAHSPLHPRVDDEHEHGSEVPYSLYVHGEQGQPGSLTLLSTQREHYPVDALLALLLWPIYSCLVHSCRLHQYCRWFF